MRFCIPFSCLRRCGIKKIFSLGYRLRSNEILGKVACSQAKPYEGTVSEQSSKDVKISKPHLPKYRLRSNEILGKVIRSQMKQYEGTTSEQPSKDVKISKPHLPKYRLRGDDILGVFV